MKTHTSSFKEQIKLMGKEIDSRITFGSTVLGKDDLNAVTPSYQGAILKSVMKQLDIDSNVAIPIGTILKYEFGLKVNGEYEYINYGNYIVYSVEKQEDTKSYKIVCYDKLLYSMLDYVKLPITYPISIRDYINAISTVLGLKFANKSETFANYNKQIQADLYDGLGYTFRDILDELAQVTASTICLNNNDELEIRYITETGDTIDEEYLKDVNVNFGEKFGAVNTIVLSRSGDSDSVYYPSTLPTNPYEIKISDNQIMNGNDRADFLPDIYDKLNGLEFYTNDFVSTGICYYDLCDRYSVKVGDNTYSCVMLNDEVSVTQGLEENIYTELPEQTETDYKHASKDDRMINQVYIIAKKNEAEILAVVNTTKQIQKEINPTKDESGSKIIIEDASNTPLTYLEIEGKSTQETISGEYLDKGKFRQGNFAGAIVDYRLYCDDNRYIEAGRTYTISTNAIDKGLKYGVNVSPVKFPTQKENIKYDSGWLSVNNYTFVSTDSGYLGISVAKANGTDNLTLDDINDVWFMLIEGATGITPSPEFPSEIESVGYENLWSLNSSYTTETGSEYVLRDTPIPTIPAGKYILSLKKSLDVDVFFNFKDTYGSSNETPVYLNGAEENLVTFPNDVSIVAIYIYGSSACTISDIQITKGTKKHSYIPYGKYGIEVETVGKNLFGNLTWDTSTYRYFKLPKENTYYTLSIRLKDGATIPSDLFLGFTEKGIYSDVQKIRWIIQNGSYGTSQKKDNFYYVNNFTSDTLLNYISVFPAHYTNSLSDYFDIQLEESDKFTEYIPYQKNISVIELNEPLRSLPNGVKDIAYIRNNKLYVERKVRKHIFKAVSSITLSNGNYYGTNGIADNIGVNSPSIFSDRILGNYTYKENTGYVTGNGGTFVIFGDDSETVETFNNKFVGTEIYYMLETPVTEELGEIEMLKTLKGYNNISTTDKLLPIINLTYVRDTIIADYVENHVAQLKITENEIKESVENVSSSVDGLNTTIKRVEEITTDNSQVINIISTNIDRTSGEVREVTTTTGFTFNKDGMTINDGSGFKAQHRSNGTYYKDGETIVGQYTKDGSKQKDLELFGIYSYGKESINDTPMFVGQLYTDENGEQGFGHFYNGEG